MSRISTIMSTNGIRANIHINRLERRRLRYSKTWVRRSMALSEPCFPGV